METDYDEIRQSCEPLDSKNSQRRWIKFPTLFLLFIAGIISITLSVVYFTKEVRNESIQQLADQYEKCECMVHSWEFLPNGYKDVDSENPVVSATLFCASGIYQTRKQMSTSNGPFMYQSDVNQTCFRPYDASRFLRVGVPDLHWTDAPDAKILMFGFVAGILWVILLIPCTMHLYLGV